MYACNHAYTKTFIRINKPFNQSILRFQNELERLQEERRADAEDHAAQVDALEKQLRSNKNFLDVSFVCLFD